MAPGCRAMELRARMRHGVAMNEGSFGYARAADGAYIGYRVDGGGSIDIVHQPEWPGNIDLEWDDVWSRAWL